MAEINFQRERSPWPWLLGLVILAGFVWFMLNYVYMPDGNQGEVLAGDSTYTIQRYIPPVDTANEVRDFVEYINSTPQNLTPKKYTEEGLIKLQSALSYIADRKDTAGYQVDEDIDSLDRTIVKIDTSARNYLIQVKPAFSVAVKAISSIEDSGTSLQNSNTVDLRTLAEGIDTSKSIKSQLGKIKKFFAEAGNVLQQVRLSYEYSLKKKVISSAL